MAGEKHAFFLSAVASLIEMDEPGIVRQGLKAPSGKSSAGAG
jgi:hypothetical protein